MIGPAVGRGLEIWKRGCRGLGTRKSHWGPQLLISRLLGNNHKQKRTDHSFRETQSIAGLSCSTQHNQLLTAVKMAVPGGPRRSTAAHRRFPSTDSRRTHKVILGAFHLLRQIPQASTVIEVLELRNGSPRDGLGKIPHFNIGRYPLVLGPKRLGLSRSFRNTTLNSLPSAASIFADRRSPQAARFT